MASGSFADLLKEAEDAGLSTYTPESGPYSLRIAGGNYRETKKGAPSFGIRYQVVGGPDDGKSFWSNIVFASPQNIAISFKYLASLGLDSDFFAGLTGDIASNADKVLAALKDIEFDADVVVKNDGQWTNINIKNVELSSGSTTAPAADPAPAAAAPAADTDDDY